MELLFYVCENSIRTIKLDTGAKLSSPFKPKHATHEQIGITLVFSNDAIVKQNN